MNPLAESRRFPARPQSLPEVRIFVSESQLTQRYEGGIDDVVLAVTEACSNAIRHSGSETIEVRLDEWRGCLQVEVRDGGMFGERLPVPELDREGHRGLMLMSAMVDEFSLSPGTSDRPGTVVRLLKCMDGSGASGARAAG